MTEKRYYIGNGKNCTICDSKKGGSDFFNMLTQFQAVDRLNELAEENQQLKNDCGILIQSNQDYRAENEQLKQQNRELQGELQDEKLGLNLWNAENTILEEEKKQLQKENKELKQRIGGLEDYKEVSIKFTQEVEDFFKRHEFDTVNFDLIDIFFDGFEFYSGKCDELKKENKELKQAIKEVLELLKEEVDLFSDKATEHDINAYIELKELDNKDAYYMAISTKKAIKLLKEMIE